MHLEGKYLLLNYRDMPDTDFICENGGDLRIRVLRIPRNKLKALPEGELLGAMDKWILVFQNVSNRMITEQEELIRAVHWYTCKFGIQQMKMLYLKR